MVSKRKIGIIYEYNENWVGGAYYIQNALAALIRVKADRIFDITVFWTDKSQVSKLKNQLGSNQFSWVCLNKRHSLWVRGINKISSILFGKRPLKVSNEHSGCDIVFPAFKKAHFEDGQEFLHWIPDFQEYFLPEFFSKDEIILRQTYQAEIIKSGRFILLSSENAKVHLNLIYSKNNLVQFVSRFAVSNPSSGFVSLEHLCKKYQIPNKYFICCNQFWQHKNHVVLLKAVGELKKAGVYFHLVLTGKPYDHRNPAYYEKLLSMVNDLGIRENVTFLGFVDRRDQLSLVKHSQALIQPSLFEGWNTSIEDAKSLSVSVIASDIEVHHEQLSNYPNKMLFTAKSPQSLSDCLRNFYPANLPYDYEKSIEEYGTTLSGIFLSILKPSALA